MKKHEVLVDMEGTYMGMDDHESGDWVRADVAQALYDALVDLKGVEESDLVGVEWNMAIRMSFKKAEAALSLADGESE